MENRIADIRCSQGYEAKIVNKAYEGGCTIVDIMKDGGAHLVMNSTESAQAFEDSRSIRNVTLMDRIPYFTTLAGRLAAALAKREGEVMVTSLQG